MLNIRINFGQFSWSSAIISKIDRHKNCQFLFTNCQQHFEVLQVRESMFTRQLLHETLQHEQWKALSVALARVMASKPHSADVERLISSYNGLKTNIRSSARAPIHSSEHEWFSQFGNFGVQAMLLKCRKCLNHKNALYRIIRCISL